MRLYEVKLQGLRSENEIHEVKGKYLELVDKAVFGTAYVIADDPTDAYYQVENYLRENNVGTKYQRAMHSVRLLAENFYSPECGIKLYPEHIQIKESDEELAKIKSAAKAAYEMRKGIDLNITLLSHAVKMVDGGKGALVTINTRDILDALGFYTKE